jgi:phage terminase large subunit-like protein
MYDKNRDDVRDTFKQMTPAQQGYIAKSWAFQARPKQLPNELWTSGEKNIWAIITGRGFGKTRTACEIIVDTVEENWDISVMIGGSNKNWDDVKKITMRGESGFLNVLKRRNYELTDKSPNKLQGNEISYTCSSGDTQINFSNGAQIILFSGEKPDKFAGYQFHMFWFDELFLYPNQRDVWDQVMFCLRLTGMVNRILITSTPRPTELCESISQGKLSSRTCITEGSSRENYSNLSEQYRETLENDYAGTRLGRQEIDGELLLDTPGALWRHDDIQHTEELPNDIIRTVVAVDPAVSNNPNSDETGIVVACKSRSGKYYVLADYTVKGSPNAWARRVASAFEEFKADRVVYEANQGGLLVEETLRTVHKTLPLTSVHASKGKYSRAEPIAALYEQGKVYHVDNFTELEKQMTSYNPEFYKGSPDRLDALVWALHELKGKGEFGFTFG